MAARPCPRRVILVGATGSIGRQAIDVAARHPEALTIVGLSAHRDEEGLLGKAASIAGAPALCLSGARPASASVRFAGREGLERLIAETDADVVLNAAAGADGLLPSLWSLRSGKDLALANKESMVMAGRLVLAEAAARGRAVLPVDSEHSAIFNMIERLGRANVRGVILTASGGAFRDRPLSSLASVTVAEALSHPTWSMGPKITVDSATMANKGLEVIEAARLFALGPADIGVVLHPESKVHSFVRARDGSLYAQASRPDMRLPIMNALSWPDMLDEDLADLDESALAMTFRPYDRERYPLLAYAYEALESGEAACVAFNAANEEAVAAFMAGRIGFLDIGAVVRDVLSTERGGALDCIDAVMAEDANARVLAGAAIKEIA